VKTLDFQAAGTAEGNTRRQTRKIFGEKRADRADFAGFSA